jgi:hypothetical protein
MGTRGDNGGASILTFENPRNVALVMLFSSGSVPLYNQQSAIRSRRARSRMDNPDISKLAIERAAGLEAVCGGQEA